MTEDSKQCVGYSAVTEQGQCETPRKFLVHSSKFGVAGSFSTCGRHLSWALNIWLRKRGQVINGVELVED